MDRDMNGISICDDRSLKHGPHAGAQQHGGNREKTRTSTYLVGRVYRFSPRPCLSALAFRSFAHSRKGPNTEPALLDYSVIPRAVRLLHIVPLLYLVPLLYINPR